MAEEKKKLSVQEMLAAARANKAAAAPATPPAEPAAEAPAEPAAEAPKAEKPKPAAAKPAAAAGAKPAGGKLSVAEMMAAARANKGPAAESPKAPEAPKPAEKPVEKPKPAAKAEPKKEKEVTTSEKESGSFLAGGPSKDKPGPITKAEAAAKESPAAKAAKEKRAAPPMPEKPAYARAPAPAPAGAKGGKGKVEDRRGFLELAFGTALGIGFTTMSATFGLWGLALARFMFPNVLREPPSAFKVGFKSDFPFGKVEEKFKAQYGVWVVNYEYNGRQEIYALSTVCTHLGCTPNWLEAEQKFKCPCHGSGFYKDGINFEGPAPRPLERYAVKIADDGQLQVDKSRKFQEEMGQWEDPTSYVSV